MNELLLCPFCGGEAVIEEVITNGFEVSCRNCACTTACSNKATVIKRWNTRAERTCTNCETGDFWRCSSCGCEMLLRHNDWVMLYMGDVNYCPNCGAKVVEE